MGMSSGCKVAFNYLTELSKLKPFSFWPNFPEAGPSPQSPAGGRVEMWRGGFRLDISVSAPFVWRCLSEPCRGSVSTSRSSNRTGGFPKPLT